MTIQLHDLQFKPYISREEIAQVVQTMGVQMSLDLRNRNPLFVGILNGSFVFMADLLRQISTPCECTFIKLASYTGTASTGKITELLSLDRSISGRTVVIVEDIIDTGTTIHHLLPLLQKQTPEEVLVCTFLLKPKALEHDLDIRYAGLKVPNDFLVGYGLDYDGLGRNLPDIYVKC
jgi:hypoxanthine phosphoribosyltransferase